MGLQATLASFATLVGFRITQNSAAFARYLAAGCFNVILCLGIYSFGIFIGLNYIVANSAAWLIGLAVSFFLNSRFVFRKRYGHARLAMFLAMNVFSLFLTTALLSLFVGVFHMNAVIASVCSIPLVVTINYLASKYGVFR